MTSWYPLPPKPAYTPIQTRVLLPVSQAPLPAQLPVLPSPLRQPFCPGYTLSTHIIPAAFPRSTPDIPLPPPLQDGWNKNERTECANRALKPMLEEKECEGSKKVLWVCVNRYIKKDWDGERKGGVTLLLTHANGFPKEIWEPTVAHLSTTATQLVDEIWSWEAVQHGDSGLINYANLPGACDWSDNTRDIINFLLSYLPSSVSNSPLPTHLARISSTESDARKSRGFSERSLVAVGHSFGGCTSALAALTYPSLFSSLILIDPVIVMKPRLTEGNEWLHSLILGAMLRRDTWSSLEEAKSLFLANPFFAAWDPSVLSIYLSCGLTPTVEGTVRLKMPGIQEALLFAHSRTSFEVWDRLERLDERVEIRWIVPGKGDNPGITGKAQTQERVWRRPGNSSNVIINNAGHLIPHEAPRELGEDISRFLVNKYGVVLTEERYKL